MSEHIKMFKTSKEHLEELVTQNKLYFNDLLAEAISGKITLAPTFECRLDSITRRFSIIISKSKKLSNTKLPVVVKKKTLSKYFLDEAVYFSNKINELKDNGELEAGSLKEQYLTKWRTIMFCAEDFVKKSKEDEVIVLTI